MQYSNFKQLEHKLLLRRTTIKEFEIQYFIISFVTEFEENEKNSLRAINIDLKCKYFR